MPPPGLNGGEIGSGDIRVGEAYAGALNGSVFGTLPVLACPLLKIFGAVSMLTLLLPFASTLGGRSAGTGDEVNCCRLVVPGDKALLRSPCPGKDASLIGDAGLWIGGFDVAVLVVGRTLGVLDVLETVDPEAEVVKIGLTSGESGIPFA